MISLVVTAACVLIIIIDLPFHPQRMWVMNIVWLLTASYAGRGHWRYGRITGSAAFLSAETKLQSAARK
jgi:hypothetical protein